MLELGFVTPNAEGRRTQREYRRGDRGAVRKAVCPVYVGSRERSSCSEEEGWTGETGPGLPLTNDGELLRGWMGVRVCEDSRCGHHVRDAPKERDWTRGTGREVAGV